MHLAASLRSGVPQEEKHDGERSCTVPEGLPVSRRDRASPRATAKYRSARVGKPLRVLNSAARTEIIRSPLARRRPVCSGVVRVLRAPRSLGPGRPLKKREQNMRRTSRGP